MRGRFFQKKNKKRIKQTTGLSVRKKKMLGLNGRECKKKKKKEDPSWKFLRKRMVRCPHQFVKKNNIFFSARHNRIVKKNCENWRNH